MGKRADTEKKIKELLLSSGMAWIAGDYKNIREKNLLIQCPSGHQTLWTGEAVLSRRPCPECKKTGYLEEVISICTARGGELLSPSVPKTTDKLRILCGEGHDTHTLTLHKLRAGGWCLKCGGRFLDKKEALAQAKEYAKSRGGRCLSTAYVNADSPMRWQCGSGHPAWDAPFVTVVRARRWCGLCAGNRVDPGKVIEEAKQIARAKHGKCLSATYTRAQEPISWQCELGHKFSATINAVRRGGWCPECSSGLKERVTRYLFEEVFQLKFPKKRPRWLKSPLSQKPMELDGFNEELGLAFEYQGEQHYKTTFDKRDGVLSAQKKRDAEKAKLCRKQGVVLIQIPYWIPTTEMQDFLVSELLKDGAKDLAKLAESSPKRQLPEWIRTDAYDFDDLKTFAKGLGGRCLSEGYEGANHKYVWQCAEGHQPWSASWASVNRQGTWCPECAGNTSNKSDRLDQAKRSASSRGGKCHAEKYENTDAMMLWECGIGHFWLSSFYNMVTKEHWCPLCAPNAEGWLNRVCAKLRRSGYLIEADVNERYFSTSGLSSTSKSSALRN